MKKITLLAMSLMMALLVNAQDVGKDITSQFENTDFETWDTSGWTIEGGLKQDQNSNAAVLGLEGTHYMEAWCASSGNLANFDGSQTHEVPNGYYVVKALAHAIKQNQTTTPVPNGVYVYAEDEQTQVTTTTAAEYTVFAEVTDGALTIGFRGVSCNVNWVVVDYFRVIQCYGDTEEAAKISWMKYEMQALATAYEDIRELDMSASLKDEIEASIAAIEIVSTYAETEALWTKMKLQMEDANACIEVYEELSAKIDEVYEFVDDKDDADDVFAVVDEIDANYYDGAYDTAGALAAIEALNDAMFDYNLAHADGSTAFPVTELYVTNPTLRENSNGWLGSTPVLGHQVMEFFNCDFDVYQELTDIPNGKYVVKVQGFYREAWNNGPEAYNAGKEVLSAELYANTEAVPLTSLYKYTAAEMGVTENVHANGQIDGLTSANLAFSTKNPLTEQNYYEENAVTVIVMDGKLKIGLRNVGHKGGSWCAFREFKLFYYGNFPAVNLLGKINTIREYLTVNESAIPAAIWWMMDEYLYEIEDYTMEGEYSDDEVNEVISVLDEKWAEAQEAIELFAALKAQVADIKTNMLPLDYPGADDLWDLVYEAEEYFDPKCEENTYEALLDLEARLNEGVREYYLSQEASEDVAADYTYFVPNPNFEQKGEWTWAVVGGGTDQWNGGCRPTEDGGASRQGVNLWGWGITSVDVHQTLTGLPNGLYKVSAEMITQNNYATDQHVYATGAATVESDYLTVTGWDTYEWTTLTTNDFAVVVDGTLTIGAASSKGGTNSEGWFQATNFKLYYYGPASDEHLQGAWDNLKAEAEEAVDVLIPNEEKEVAAALAEATSMADAGSYAEACALLSPVLAAWDSTIVVSKNFYNDYYARLDTIRLRDGYENCELTYAFADATIALADAILESDTTTCNSFPTLDEKLHAYANYAASLRDAENALKDSTVTYLDEHVAFLVDSIITPQNDTLLCQLATVEYCNILRESLDKAVNIFISTANFSKEINEGDVTYLIINPTCDIENDDANNVPGWTWVQGTGDKATHDAEHYDTNVNSANKARFLNSWGSGLNSTFYQEIIGIPDGTYKLTVAARTDGDNAYIFAATTPSGIKNDTTVWQMVKNYGNTRGEIWSADSLLWEADGRPETKLEENYPYFMARPDSMGYGTGYGWSWHVIENIEVTNRYLNIGFTADNTLTGKDNFTGWWMSADDWKLELIKKNEVQSEYNPFAGVEEIIEEAPAPVVTGIYDLFGRRIDAITAPGLYIVNGKKVLVK